MDVNMCARVGGCKIMHTYMHTNMCVYGRLGCEYLNIIHQNPKDAVLGLLSGFGAFWRIENGLNNALAFRKTNMNHLSSNHREPNMNAELQWLRGEKKLKSL